VGEAPSNYEIWQSEAFSGSFHEELMEAMRAGGLTASRRRR